MRYVHSCTPRLPLVDCAAHNYIRVRKKRGKGKKMFEPIRKFAKALRAPTRAEREMAYLNGALDRVDLEYRQRQIDNGLFRGRV